MRPNLSSTSGSGHQSPLAWLRLLVALMRGLALPGVVLAVLVMLTACKPPIDPPPPTAAKPTTGLSGACGPAASDQAAGDHDGPAPRFDLLLDVTADELPLGLPRRLQEDLRAKAEVGYTISVGVIGGTASVDQMWLVRNLRPAHAERGDRRREQAAKITNRVVALAGCAKTTVPGSDVLGAIQAAARDLRAGRQPGTAPPELAVVSNGLANTGALDLRQEFSGEAAPKDLVRRLAASGNLPDLRGVQVHFYHLGLTTSPLFRQQSNVAWLTSVWREICDAAGATCRIEDDFGDKVPWHVQPPADFAFKAPPPLPKDPCKGRPIRCDVPSPLLFDPGQDTLRAGADRVLRPVADRLRRTAERAVVKGHTASWGSRTYRQDLSERRARAVVRRLVELGVPRARLTAIGVGSREQIARDLDAAGRLVEPLASRNRRVELIFKRYPQGAAAHLAPRVRRVGARPALHPQHPQGVRTQDRLGRRA